MALRLSAAHPSRMEAAGCPPGEAAAVARYRELEREREAERE